MNRYNKAFQGGAGAAVALIATWAIGEWGGIVVPEAVELAFATLLAGVVPALGPRNAS